MSNENTETGTENTENAEQAQRGQTKKTAEELHAAFEAAGVDGLLEVDDKGRCTVRQIDGKRIVTLYGPKAGNTFLRALEGAVAMGPYLSA